MLFRSGYDPLGRRAWREQYRDLAGTPLAQAKRSHYLYAGEGLVAESQQDITLNADGSVSASAAPAITTQYGPRPDAQFTTGMLFIKTRNSNNQDTVAYYHHDQIGTPVQATDKAGNIVWSAHYNAFGKASITTPAATADKPTIASNLRLPGQIEDPETGLHYNYHRYYDASTGRYITQDPIGLAGGINQYAYVGGNPLTYTDPLGLNPAMGCALGVWAGPLGCGAGAAIGTGVALAAILMVPGDTPKDQCPPAPGGKIHAKACEISCWIMNGNCASTPPIRCRWTTRASWLVRLQGTTRISTTRST